MNLKTLLTAGLLGIAPLTSLSQSINKHKDDIHHTITLHNGREKDAEQLYHAQQDIGTVSGNRLYISDIITIDDIPIYHRKHYSFILESNTYPDSLVTTASILYDQEYITSIQIANDSQGVYHIKDIQEHDESGDKILRKLGLKSHKEKSKGPKRRGLRKIIKAMEFFKEQTKNLTKHHEALSGGSK